ncbi:MAG: penicillin-binding transpeptidase domain-containing protein [Marmoricola sp.]
MRRTLGGLLALALAAVVAGCSIGGGPEPDQAADTVAAAFSRQDIGSVDFSGESGKQAQTEVTRILAGMNGLPVKVTAGDLKPNGDKATGMLTWTWAVAGKPWVTKSPMSLVKDQSDTWRVVWDRRLVNPQLAAGEKLEATTLLAERGDILGAAGHRVVTLRPVDRYGIDKRNISTTEAASSARQLVTLLDVGIDASSYATRVRHAGPNAFVEAVTLRRGTGEEPNESAVQQISGALSLPAMVPLAPTRSFAAPILGTVGEPSAEMIKKSKGALKVGDQVGLTGLQARYDAQLSGTPGVRIDLVDAKDNQHTQFRTEPVTGKPLRTTLDLQAQTLAEKTLAGTTSPSALVAIRPSTGDILAAASGPKSNGYNTATYGRYPPGSTFKVVSSLALLRAGITPDTEVDCPATLTVDGKRFKNYSDYPSTALGRIPFRTAIANSCNTAVIGQRGRLGQDRSGQDTLTDAAAALGLGVDHDLGFPAYFGSAPPATSDTDGAADLIGQGTVQASPLTMATVAASVQKGSVVVPRLLPDQKTATTAPTSPLTAKEAAQLRTLMRGVVTDGSGRLLLGLPGAPVLAKTGTAEYGTRSTPGAPLRTHAWMIATHGDLAVAVFVADGSSGSGTAGPILKQFLLGTH